MSFKNFVFGAVLLAPIVAQTIESKVTAKSRGMTVRRELVAKDVGPVWGMAFLPTGEILMTLKDGRMKRFNPKTKTFLDVAGAPASAEHGQGGLLDVVLAADFKKSRRVYVSYAKEVGKNLYTTALATAIYEGGKLSGLREIFVAEQGSSKGEHFGGRIVAQGPDSIFLSVGERGDRKNSQTLENHLGKILRLTADGKPHPDNPFLTRDRAKPEIYSFGHRNPQGMALHPETGELWAHEHGPRGGDEINFVRKGLNYGWPLATYGREYWGPSIGPETAEGTEPPVHHWTPSIAPCGLVIGTGGNLSGWKGLFISGALAQTHLNLVEIKNGKAIAQERLFGSDELRIREVEQAPDGMIWYATDEGYLFRVSRGN